MFRGINEPPSVGQSDDTCAYAVKVICFTTSSPISVASVVRQLSRSAERERERTFDGPRLQQRVAGQSGNIVSPGRAADRLAVEVERERERERERESRRETETETPEWDSIRVYVFSLGSEMNLIWTLTGPAPIARAAHAQLRTGRERRGWKTLKQLNSRPTGKTAEYHQAHEEHERSRSSFKWSSQTSDRQIDRRLLYRHRLPLHSGLPSGRSISGLNWNIVTKVFCNRGGFDGRN